MEIDGGLPGEEFLGCRFRRIIKEIILKHVYNEDNIQDSESGITNVVLLADRVVDPDHLYLSMQHDLL